MPKRREVDATVSLAGGEAPDGPLPVAPVRYEDRGPLGEGSMGVVDLMHDRWIGRDVARKSIQPDQQGDGWIRHRFEREARIQGQLEHPAIVPVYDVSIYAEGVASFTMRRVQGKSLRDIIDALREKDSTAIHQHGLRRRLASFARICLAIAFAHQRGVVHRDIKPSNIMFGDFGEVYVLDWGVARVLGEEERAPEGVRVAPALPGGATEAGDLIGTIGYMSPEQATGELAERASDVYALGATLFEVLTLQRLHSRDSDEALRELAHGLERRPSVRAPDVHVSPELDDLCVRACAPRAADRPTAQELHDGIQAFLDGQRDLERRNQLVAEHVRKAMAQLSSSSGVLPDEAREIAMREVHRALALDPENEPAIELLHTIIHAPAVGNREADVALLASAKRARVHGAGAGIALLGVWIAGVLGIAALGVRTWPPIIVATLSLFAAGAVLSTNRGFERPWRSWLAIVLADLGALLSALAFGPMIVLPGLLAFLGVGLTIVNRRSAVQRRGDPGVRFMHLTAVLSGPVVFILAIALEFVGVYEPSLAFKDGTIVILPRSVDFSPAAAYAYLVLVNAVLIAGPAMVVIRLQDYMFEMERRTLGMAARLRSLLPVEARQATLSLTTEIDSEKTGDLGPRADA